MGSAKVVRMGWRRDSSGECGRLAAAFAVVARVVSPTSFGLAGRFFDRPVG
jgi:hypothetical protein